MNNIFLWTSLFFNNKLHNNQICGPNCWMIWIKNLKAECFTSWLIMFRVRTYYVHNTKMFIICLKCVYTVTHQQPGRMQWIPSVTLDLSRPSEKTAGDGYREPGWAFHLGETCRWNSAHRTSPEPSHQTKPEYKWTTCAEVLEMTRPSDKKWLTFSILVKSMPFFGDISPQHSIRSALCNISTC